MPAHNQRDATSKGNGQYLGKLNHVKGAQNRHFKDLGPYNIDTGNRHHQQYCHDSYPFKP